MKKKSIYDHMTKSERIVAQFLKDLGIFWSYEKPIYVWDRNKRPRVWTPDFFLAQFSIYVEVCGSEDFDYEYRRKILDKNGIRVIFLHLYKEDHKWKQHFLYWLKEIIVYRSEKLKDIIPR